MAKNNSDEQDKLILRISECETVINDLDNSPVWRIILRDLKKEQKELDDNWQTIWNNDQLLAARVLKFATKHILDTRQKYKEELTEKKKLLRQLQNPDKEIIKDYDIFNSEMYSSNIQRIADILDLYNSLLGITLVDAYNSAHELNGTLTGQEYKSKTIEPLKKKELSNI